VGWLSEEWAAASDEDDGLVVMLKARIENLQGQLARYSSPTKPQGFGFRV
jgi:hypothetical protein